MKPKRATRALSVEAVSAMSSEEIAEKSMPGWKRVRPRALADTASEVEADATLPSLAELRRKYLGEHASDGVPVDDAEKDSKTTDVVTLESGDLQRKVGIDKKTGAVTWRQG